MPNFNLTRGQRYKATLTLGWVEQFAGNDLIAGELAKAGFADVAVEGSGETRVAEGTWTGDDQDIALPEQVTSLEVLS
ncbi:MAG: hypothetical protein ACT4N2_05595 [Hyphomicrobium sp.]